MKQICHVQSSFHDLSCNRKCRGMVTGRAFPACNLGANCERKELRANQMGPQLKAEICWPTNIPLRALACNYPWQPHNIEPRVDYLSHAASSPVAMQWMQNHLLGLMMNSVGHTKSDMLCSDTIALENHSDWCWHWPYLDGWMRVFENLGHMQFL